MTFDPHSAIQNWYIKGSHMATHVLGEVKSQEIAAFLKQQPCTRTYTSSCKWFVCAHITTSCFALVRTLQTLYSSSHWTWQQSNSTQFILSKVGPISTSKIGSYSPGPRSTFSLYPRLDVTRQIHFIFQRLEAIFQIQSWTLHPKFTFSMIWSYIPDPRLDATPHFHFIQGWKLHPKFTFQWLICEHMQLFWVFVRSVKLL